MPFALGVIGLGRMAQALVIPLIEQGLIPADEVIAVVGRKDSVATVSARVPSGVNVVAASDPSAQDAWAASVQLLAVKPQMLDGVAASAPSAIETPESGSRLLLSAPGEPQPKRKAKALNPIQASLLLMAPKQLSHRASEA